MSSSKRELELELKLEAGGDELHEEEPLQESLLSQLYFSLPLNDTLFTLSTYFKISTPFKRKTPRQDQSYSREHSAHRNSPPDKFSPPNKDAQPGRGTPSKTYREAPLRSDESPVWKLPGRKVSPAWSSAWNSSRDQWRPPDRKRSRDKKDVSSEWSVSHGKSMSAPPYLRPSHQPKRMDSMQVERISYISSSWLLFWLMMALFVFLSVKSCDCVYHAGSTVLPKTPGGFLSVALLVIASASVIMLIRSWISFYTEVGIAFILILLNFSLVDLVSLCLMPGRFSRLIALGTPFSLLLIAIFSWCVYELATW